MAVKHDKPTQRWSTAAVAMVVLAALLAGFGLYFAINHAWIAYGVKIDDLRGRAIEARERVGERVMVRVGRVLVQVADAYREGRDELGLARSGIGDWIASAYVWDGSGLAEISLRGVRGEGDARSGDAGDDLAMRPLIAEHLERFLAGFGPGLNPGVRFLRDDVGKVPLLLACQVYAPTVDSSELAGAATGDGADAEGSAGESEAGTEPFVAAVRIDVQRLQTSVLEDHFASLGIRVVAREEGSARYWSEPVAGGLDPLRLEPAPSLIAAHQRNLVLQIVLYVLITAGFVVALTIMIAKFIRLVRREVALSRLRSNFVADVSHELKTPLALIRMFSEMLGEDRVPSEEKRREYYAIIQRESSRLTHMIDNILDFSRIDAGKKEFSFETVDVAAVVRDTYEAYRFDLDRQKFDHRLVVAEDLPRVQADGDAIAQAIINLISNAIKYSAREKSLVIELSRETRRGKHGVLICVSDSGIGIKPEDRSHLFDGFYRADDEHVRKQRGAGLGLSLVKSIVDAHGGILDVESRLVKGTTFRIFLPQGAGESRQPLA